MLKPIYKFLNLLLFGPMVQAEEAKFFLDDLRLTFLHEDLLMRGDLVISGKQVNIQGQAYSTTYGTTERPSGSESPKVNVLIIASLSRSITEIDPSFIFAT